MILLRVGTRSNYLPLHIETHLGLLSVFVWPIAQKVCFDEGLHRVMFAFLPFTSVVEVDGDDVAHQSATLSDGIDVGFPLGRKRLPQKLFHLVVPLFIAGFPLLITSHQKLRLELGLLNGFKNAMHNENRRCRQ